MDKENQEYFLLFLFIDILSSRQQNNNYGKNDTQTGTAAAGG